MIAWLVFGGAPLLAAAWMAVAGLSATEEERLARIGAAAAQGTLALVLFYGVAGLLFVGWLMLWTIAA